MSTQWRTGFAGATGLDYGALYPLIDRVHGRDTEDWDALLSDVQACESGALQAMSAARK